MKKITLLLLLFISLVSVASAQTAKKSSSIVTIEGQPYYVHPVEPGDAFYSLTRIYGVDESEIIRNNPQTADGLKTGQILKIPVKSLPVQEMTQRQKNKRFDTHVVNAGETAWSISQRYGISVNTLIEDNEGFDPLHLSIGQEINIRTKEQGKTSSAEITSELTNYGEALSSVLPGFEHHLVKKGETLSSLSRMYEIPVDSISFYNRLRRTDILREGTMLRIPTPHSERTTGTTSPEETGQTELPRQEPGRRQPFDISDYFRKQNEGNIETKRIDIQRTIRIAMLLPLQSNGRSNRNFLEFYQGALIALEDLKAMGISSRIDLYNTGRSAEETERVLRSREFQDADLIIGPVYEECLLPVMEFASRERIPVISPLATLNNEYNSLLWQVSPDPSTRYDKLREELSDDRNVIVFSTTQNDPEMEREISAILPNHAQRINYVRSSAAQSQLEKILSRDKENVLIVLSRSNTEVEEILAWIASVQANLVATSRRPPMVKVVGNPSWLRFQNLTRDIFFKLNVMFVAPYHADRGNQRVINFDQKYISAYNTRPGSLYGYRGYDVTKLFVGAMKLHGNRFGDYINDSEMALLQTPYRFEQTENGVKFTNRTWPLVCYRNDFIIEVK